jgi:hypothetical protein
MRHVRDRAFSVAPDNAEHREAIVPKWNESPLFYFFTRHYPRRLPQALLGVKPDADEAQGL